ncbi:hypothetical protein EJ994_01910 [Maribacter sp. MJ134]|uniref:hypothetical protein n=1 Tax=Maribacter sp. MJ134 TaxID=2496865 RepID=UPI000F840919|nr:hypothetical protein [Maribacter sp. MJ134]AZQ57618.1 hypothetical protein EJ994_01910 [Maribacter sp. MJ134]
MKRILAFTLIAVVVSCKQDKAKFEKIDFETEYLFDSEIETKILSDTIENSKFGSSFKYQIGAADYATKGNYKKALATWDLAMGTSEKNYTQSQIDSINGIYKKVNANDYIIEEAKQNQVLIINEAHHSSRHRVFTKSLLQRLYDNGYKNIGFEALTNGEDQDSSLNSRKYPIQKTGYYIKDPQFGDLVRTALEIGYHVFSYEQTSDVNGKEREIEQARNIQNVMEQKPNEKFLIHCGFGHALEGNYSAWGKAMAGRLAEFTEIDPLTIYQAYYSEKSKPEFNHPLLKALGLTESTVLIDANDKPMKYENAESFSDIAVLHPNTIYENGRPNWLFDNGNKPTQISLKEIDISFPIMVLVYKKGEDILTAVPMDIVEVENKTNLALLALRKGEYEVVVKNLDGDARKFQLYVE